LSSAEKAPHQKIGKYEILEKIGQGAMGIVYKAMDPLMERIVAIKTMSADLEAAPEMRTRFFREARSAGQLSHRNIITIFELGEEDRRAYMVMEFMDGEDLGSKIARGDRMPLEDKLRVMGELCDGLWHAHQKKVIHRDIKPGNIFITQAGVLKILDFGLAHVASSDMTKTGSVLGTPNYMAPEQVRGDKIDHRSDIFSAGALFYEFLTLRKPFQAPSLHATFFKILQDEPEPIDHIDPTLPGDLAALVARALAKDPAERYQSVDHLIKDLESVRRSVAHRVTGLQGEARQAVDRLDRLIEENRDLLKEEQDQRQKAERTVAMPLEFPQDYQGILEIRDRATRDYDHLCAVLDKRKQAAALLEQAAQLEGQGDLQGALKAAEAALNEVPLHSKADSLARRLRETLARLAREEEIRQEVGRLVETAKDLERRGELGASLVELDRALILDPAHAQAVSLRKKVGAALAEERRREQAKLEERRRKVEETLTLARKALAAGDYARARSDAERGLAIDPESAGARELIEEADRGRERAERAERERRERIETAFARVLAAEAGGDLEAAIELAGLVLAEEEAHPGARQFLERAQSELRVRRQREEVERKARAALSAAETLAKTGDYRAATSLLQRADSSVASAVKQALEQYREAAHAQEAARELSRQLEEPLDRGKKAFEKGQYDACTEAMKQVLSLAPDHAEAQTYVARAREREEQRRREEEQREQQRQEAKLKEEKRKEEQRKEEQRKEEQRREQQRKEEQRKEDQRKEEQRKEEQRREQQRKEEQRKEDQRKTQVLETVRAAEKALAAGQLEQARKEAARARSLDPGSAEATRVEAEVARRQAELRDQQRQQQQRQAETAVLVPKVPSTPPPVPVAPPTARALPTKHLYAAVAAAALVGLGVVGMIMLTRTTTTEQQAQPASPSPAAQPPRPSQDPEAARGVAEATRLLESQEFAQAAKKAKAVLQSSPGNGAAQDLLRRAQESLDKIERSREQAQSLFAAGKHEEAAAALAEVLRLAPADAEARKLSSDLDRYARKTADGALAKLNQAKSAAQQARAADLAEAAVNAARQAESDALGLYGAKQYSQAAGKFGQATEAYRRAESEARAEADRRAEAERRADAERKAEAERQRALAQRTPSPTPAREAPPAVDEAALLAQRQMDDSRRAMEAAKRGVQPGDPRAAAEESVGQDLVRQGKLAEAAAAFKRATALYESEKQDRQAIQALLQGYKTAMEGKDLSALRSLWPGLSQGDEKKLAEGFKLVRSWRVELQVTDLTLAGDTATVTCERRVEAVSVNGTTPQSRTSNKFSLRKKGGSWIIEGVQ